MELEAGGCRVRLRRWHALEGLRLTKAAVAGDRLARGSGVPTFNGAVSRS